MRMLLVLLAACATTAPAPATTTTRPAAPRRACPDDPGKLAARAMAADHASTWCLPIKYRDGHRWFIAGSTHADSLVGVFGHDGTVIAKAVSTSDPELESFEQTADLDRDGVDEVIYIASSGDDHRVTVIAVWPRIARASAALPNENCERLEIAETVRERHVIVGCEDRVRYRWSRGRLVKL